MGENYFNGGSQGSSRYASQECRIIEFQDGKDLEELWLYIRKYEDGSIKYAFTNALATIEIAELHHAATLRWPIEQSFQECKSFLGMDHYETRSYRGWHRHMLLVMVATFLWWRFGISFLKNEPVLTMPQALILIVAAMTQELAKIKKALRDVSYYQMSNTKAYHSHRKKRLQNTA